MTNPKPPTWTAFSRSAVEYYLRAGFESSPASRGIYAAATHGLPREEFMDHASLLTRLQDHIYGLAQATKQDMIWITPLPSLCEGGYRLAAD